MEDMTTGRILMIPVVLIMDLATNSPLNRSSMNKIMNLKQNIVKNKDTVLVQVIDPALEDIGQIQTSPVVQEDKNLPQEDNQNGIDNKNMVLDSLHAQKNMDLNLNQAAAKDNQGLISQHLRENTEEVLVISQEITTNKGMNLVQENFQTMVAKNLDLKNIQAAESMVIAQDSHQVGVKADLNQVSLQAVNSMDQAQEAGDKLDLHQVGHLDTENEVQVMSLPATVDMVLAQESHLA